MTIQGIDVSHWQGVIDWAKVKASGIQFAIIKAGGSDAGLYKDSKFEKNYAAAKAVGMPVGCYYFVGKQCHTAEKGKEEAKHFLSLIAGKQFEYPVSLDLEGPVAATKQGNTDAAIAFCEEMEKAGYYINIYGSDISGFKDRMDLSRLGAYDKWVARYGSKPKHVQEYGMWQKSSSGSVAGISGRVDMDEAYKDYPAIIKAAGLNGFAKQGTIPEEPKEEIQEPKDDDTKVIIGTAMAKCGMNVRLDSNTKGKIIGGVAKGKSVKVLEILSNGWYRIVWPNEQGFAYVSNKSDRYFYFYPTQTKTEQVNTSVKVAPAQSMDKKLAGKYKAIEDMGLMAAPGASGAKNTIARIPKGGTVQNYGYYTMKNGQKWLYVTYNGTAGHCLADLLM